MRCRWQRTVQRPPAARVSMVVECDSRVVVVARCDTRQAGREPWAALASAYVEQLQAAGHTRDRFQQRAGASHSRSEWKRQIVDRGGCGAGIKGKSGAPRART